MRFFNRGREPFGPQIVDAGPISPGSPWGPRENNVREVRHYKAGGNSSDRPAGDRDVLSGGLLVLAGVIIAASAVGAGYVSYGSQKLFALAHLAGADKGHHRASIIAALPDAGWIAMALVGLVAALLGRSSLRARVGILLFFGLSLAAQVMYAPKTAKGGWDSQALLVAVIAPIALAWMLETFVVEVRRWAAERRGLSIDESPIITSAVYGLGRGLRAGLRFPLWLVRLCLDWDGSKAGVREWVLDVAPLAPGRTRASMRADEAVARAGTAEEIAAQAKQQAATLIEEAQQAAAAQVSQIREETGQETDTVRRQAAQQAEQMRAQMAAQLKEITRRHEQQTTRLVHEADARTERLHTEANAQIERLTSINTGLSDDVDRLREHLEVLSGNTTAKARLHALYEQLGRDGDPRYLDRTRIRELAKELGPQAGLQSEGTADAYLRDYIATKSGVNGTVGGRGTAANGAMIMNGA
jgi:hypothetical protein